MTAESSRPPGSRSPCSSARGPGEEGQQPAEVARREDRRAEALLVVHVEAVEVVEERGTADELEAVAVARLAHLGARLAGDEAEHVLHARRQRAAVGLVEREGLVPREARAQPAQLEEARRGAAREDLAALVERVQDLVLLSQGAAGGS